MRPLLCAVSVLGVSLTVCATAAESPVIAPGSTLEKLAGGFEFTEGPTSDPAGNVYFTDQPNNRILKWSTEGTLTTFLQPAGRANGMCFDPAGILFICADEKMELWELKPGGQPTPLVKDFEDRPLNGPNDVWVHPQGALYFTDPFYKRPWWDHATAPQPGQHVYCLSADRGSLRRVIEDLSQPNGIVGSPDGRSLYVSDIKAGKTYRYAIQPDGSLVDKALFCELGSDGMTLDREGNLYLTGRGVTVFDREGKQVEHIDVPERWTANVCFGGPGRQTLFITASRGFYSIEMKVRGVGPGK